MRVTYTINSALKSLAANKSRSFLTILGIVIGISSIILVMSMGQGAQNLILSSIQSFGSRTVFIVPGQEASGPSGFAEVMTNSLTQRDVEAIRDPMNVQGVEFVAPLVFQVMFASFENEVTRPMVVGGSELLSVILDVRTEEGRMFSNDDIRRDASVVVLGRNISHKLFGLSNPIGERIRLGDQQFTVIGVLPQKGQVSFLNLDETVFVPYTTAQKYLFGIDYFHRIIVQAEDQNSIPRMVQDITLTLRETHGIDDPEKDDFWIITQEDAAERVGTITGILTAFIASVAAISLIVGGIGIMNIMLVSVSERTREIGLRKALGARRRDILNQFLVEAIVLTVIGGVVGIALGSFLGIVSAFLLSHVLGVDWIFSFPIQAAVLGLVVSSGVGLVFGLYPAREASKKSPIEALRYE
jgi:putative ABC transport system permease protein